MKTTVVLYSLLGSETLQQVVASTVLLSAMAPQQDPIIRRLVPYATDVIDAVVGMAAVEAEGYGDPEFEHLVVEIDQQFERQSGQYYEQMVLAVQSADPGMTAQAVTMTDLTPEEYAAYREVAEKVWVALRDFAVTLLPTVAPSN